MNTTTFSTPVPPPPEPGRWRPEAVRDLIDQLIWPGLLRIPALGLAPSRVGLAFFTLLLLTILWKLPTLWIGGPGPLEAAGERATAGVLGFAEAMGLLPPGPGSTQSTLGTAAADLFVRAPAALVTAAPRTAAALCIPTLLVWCIGFGAIGRSAACDFCRNAAIPWPQALGFSIARWPSLTGALAGPVILVAAIAAVIAAVAGALLSFPGGDVLAAVLSPIGLVLAAVGVLALVGFILGQKLIIPAVVCEGTDAVDAVQRAYAYLLGRPLVFFVYLAIFGIAAGVALVIAAVLATAVDAFALAAAGWWAGPRGLAILGQDPGLAGTARFSAAILRLVLAVPAGLVAAYALSLYASGSTVLYVLLRQVNDGQEPGELWMPGMVDGVLTPDPESPSGADDDE